MMRDRESHLGEVIGTIMPPMRPIRRVVHKHPRWIENGTDLLIAIIATGVFVPMIILGLWIAFALAGRSPVG